MNSEFDEVFSGAPLHDDAPEIRPYYRYYFVPGTAHITETIDCSSDGNGVEADGQTPATYLPELRARFLQGHKWAKPPSAQYLHRVGRRRGKRLRARIRSFHQVCLGLREGGASRTAP